MAIIAPTLRRYSIAQVRHNLATLVCDVERLGPVEVTRRGQTVAILVAAEDYERFRGQRPSFWDALQRFRRDHALLDIDPRFSNDLRDRSPGVARAGTTPAPPGTLSTRASLRRP